MVLYSIELTYSLIFPGYRSMLKRQELFVEHYSRCGNAAESARLAGYAPGSAKVTGCRLLTNANVRAALRQRQEALSAESRLSRVKVVNEILGAIDLARGRYDPGTMIRGFSEIARMMGFYESTHHQKRRLPNHETLKHRLTALSDAELLNMIDGRNAEDMARPAGGYPPDRVQAP